MTMTPSPSLLSLIFSSRWPKLARAALPLAAAVAMLSAGCGAPGANCRPVNSWSAPVFACATAQAEPEPEPEPEPLMEPEPEPEPEPEERAVMREDKIELMQTVQFETGNAVLLEESKSLLDEVAKLLQDAPEITKVRVEGHTDSVGGRSLNQRLSRERAQSVKAYLVSQGVDRDRLVTRGFGMSQPVADNDTEEGRYRNRRVEFTILNRAAE